MVPPASDSDDNYISQASIGWRQLGDTVIRELLHVRYEIVNQGWMNSKSYTIVELTNDEVEAICDGSRPIAALAALIPNAGPFIAAFIALSTWALSRMNKKHGCRGVLLRLNDGWGYQILPGRFRVEILAPR